MEALQALWLLAQHDCRMQTGCTQGIDLQIRHSLTTNSSDRYNRLAVTAMHEQDFAFFLLSTWCQGRHLIRLATAPCRSPEQELSAHLLKWGRLRLSSRTSLTYNMLVRANKRRPAGKHYQALSSVQAKL